MTHRPRPIALLIRSAACLVLAMPLAASAAEADTPVTLAPERVVSDGQLGEWLREGNAFLSDEDFLMAALKYQQVVQDGDPANVATQDAQFQLGVALTELGLNQSALTRFESVVDTGPDHAKYSRTLAYLLKIARATGSDPSVLLNISEFPPELYPAENADELHFLVGQFFYGENQLADALTRFKQVGESSEDFFVRAKYLGGVIHVAQSGLGANAREIDGEKLGLAADAFKEVLRYQRDVASNDIIDRTAGKAILALGRLFYSTRQYDVAVRYYNEVSRESSEWLSSVYESSWVHFQLKDYPRALGNLHTLNSPYFRDFYFPESRVLQALMLFYNCRYDETDAVVKDFVQDYFPLMDLLRKEINQFADPNAFYQWLASLSKRDDSEYSVRFQRIFDAALADKKLRRKFDTVSKLNDELATIRELEGENAAAGELMKELAQEIVEYRTLVVGEAGGLAQGRLLRVLSDLKGHLAGALKIKQETLKARRGDSSPGVLAEQAAATAKRPAIEADDEHVDWPFTGEYWRDELGSYLYDIHSLCKMDDSAPSAP